jgi:hypothetical protein
MVEMTAAESKKSDPLKINGLYTSISSEIEKSAVVGILLSTVHKSYYQI